MGTHLTGPRKWSHLEVAKLLTSHTAMTELTIEDAMKVVQRMHTRPLKQGVVLVQEGTTGNNYMLLILNGEAVVENESLRKADALLLGIVGPGNIIGEMGVFDDEPRSATCRAFTDMEVAVLERDALADLIAAEPAIGCKLLAALLQRAFARLRATNKKLRLAAQVNRALDHEIESLSKPAAAAAAPAPYVGNPLMS